MINNTLSPSTSTSTINSHHTIPVQVAIRVRPLNNQDRSQPRFSNSSESDLIKVFNNSTLAVIPYQKSFQFDHVFDSNSTQEQVFNTIGVNMIDRFVDGYNVTILAYGQTSSGKTYTMGTAMDNLNHSSPEQEGIIPRAMSTLFKRLSDTQKNNNNISSSSNSNNNNNNKRTTATTSGLRAPIKLRPVSMIKTIVDPKANRNTVHVSFIEIYNEELIDLLNPAPPNERTPVTIREDTKGQIIWSGLKEVPVGNTEDVLKYLQLGTKNRATGSTDMNAKSSRSHAIFSVTLKQEKWVPTNKPRTSAVQRHSTLNVKALVGQMEKRATEAPAEEDGEWVATLSKFHFVDLAGSERLKRTAAEGDRRKEGININAGLLALGNVISALSHKSTSTHIPYRDSKLTRLLQDSLGGNSTTLMIACISPAEVNLTETLNTIKYAERARHIRNKSEKNETEEWMTTDNLDLLRNIVSKLKAELKTLKHRNSPSPLSISSGTKSHLMTPSVSSLSENPSVSISATTNITVPEATISSDLMCESNSDIAILISDYRRQIEELQNELTVTRERNVLVESELRQKKQGQEFQHLVEPVIEEYEKSINALESKLAMTKTALSESDNALAEQRARYEDEIQQLDILKDQLQKSLERERVSESYCLDLEAQLEKSVLENQKDQQVLSVLREKIIDFKKTDGHTEQYINDLETRLNLLEAEKSQLNEKIESNEYEDLQSQYEDLQSQVEEYQSKCQELEQEIALLSQKPDVKDKDVQSEEYVDQEQLAKINNLSVQLTEKENQLKELEFKLNEITELKQELVIVRQQHAEQVSKFEAELSQLRADHEQELAEQVTSHQALMDSLKEIYENKQEQDTAKIAELEQQLKELEIKTQSIIQSQLEQLNQFKSDMNGLQIVEEKQDAIIQGLECKLEEMDHIVHSLRSQLEERNQTIELLTVENQKKTELASRLQRQLESLLKEVCGMGNEKKQLEQVMQFVEGTLRIQDAKSEKTMATLEDIQHHYKKEVEEKRQTVNLLAAEKQELIAQITQRASQDEEKMKHLEVELNETRLSLNEKSELVQQLKSEQTQTQFELQRVLALEARVQELDHHIELLNIEKQKDIEKLENALQSQVVQNENLTKTVAELEETIKEERAMISAQDSTGMIAELENKLTVSQQNKRREDDVWKAQMEKTREELYMSRKENEQYKKTIDVLEKSLEEIKKQLDEQQSQLSLHHDDTDSDDNEQMDKILELCEIDEASLPSQKELLQKIMQLQEDNTQLMKLNDNLESQLVLQRGQLTLETKNLELELMKLTAANDRLEKEMEQVIPRNTSGSIHRDSVQFTSPPQTPRMSSPIPNPSNSTGIKLQRDVSQSSIAKMSKSGSYRSVSTMLMDNNSEEEAMKRLSSVSMRSELISPRPSSSLRSSRTIINANVLPPPTAPPSNPLPPIPTPLPPPPPSSTSSSPLLSSDQLSESSSPLMQPTNLQRQDSINSTSFSEIMNATSNFTADQYDKLIRSLQRKTQVAESDVRAHQDVITKLESQLSRSELSMREVKKQLDALNREKQAYNLEIQNLRTQVSQFQLQQQSISDEAIGERKDLEEKLEEQRVLKEKAEKARRILENRMEELMNKKSKFMCF